MPKDGGLIVRGGEVIGSMRDLRGGIAVTCHMHKCGTVVHRMLGHEACARWIAAGTSCPRNALPEEKERLRKLHMAVPFPKRYDVWYRH